MEQSLAYCGYAYLSTRNIENGHMPVYSIEEDRLDTIRRRGVGTEKIQLANACCATSALRGTIELKAETLGSDWLDTAKQMILGVSRYFVAVNKAFRLSIIVLKGESRSYLAVSINAGMKYFPLAHAYIFSKGIEEPFASAL